VTAEVITRRPRVVQRLRVERAVAVQGLVEIPQPSLRPFRREGRLAPGPVDAVPEDIGVRSDPLRLAWRSLQRLLQVLPVDRPRDQEMLDHLHDGPLPGRRTEPELGWQQPRDLVYEPAPGHLQVGNEALSLQRGHGRSPRGTGIEGRSQEDGKCKRRRPHLPGSSHPADCADGPGHEDHGLGRGEFVPRRHVERAGNHVTIFQFIEKQSRLDSTGL